VDLAVRECPGSLWLLVKAEHEQSPQVEAGEAALEHGLEPAAPEPGLHRTDRQCPVGPSRGKLRLRRLSCGVHLPSRAGATPLCQCARLWGVRRTVRQQLGRVHCQPSTSFNAARA